MRRAALLAFVFLLGAAAPAFAREAKCPLPVHECLFQYLEMRQRPWLGIEIETDSLTHEKIIRNVVPGSAAEKAGVHAGDVLQKVEHADHSPWFAGKAGWKTGEHALMAVTRKGRERTLDLVPGQIPEDYLAHLIGVHMLEGHLAYASKAEDLEAQ